MTLIAVVEDYKNHKIKQIMVQTKNCFVVLLNYKLLLFLDSCQGLIR